MSPSIDARGAPALSARLGPEAAKAPRPPHERWLIAGSLVTVAVGVVLSVALLQYHFVLGGESAASGPIQAFVVGVYRTLGFVPGLYLGLLLLLWGGVAFVTGTWRDPLRRVAASVIFCFCLAILTTALGGGGGRIGDVIGGRLIHAFGSAPVTLLLALMSIMALLLATDWFFFRTFRGMARPSFDRTRDAGLELGEEDGLAALQQVEPRLEPAEERRRRLGLVPVPASPSAAVQEHAVSTATAARRREQELMNRVLEEARRDLLAGTSESLATAVAPEDEAGEVFVLAEDEEHDVLAELENDDLLAKAGEALDRMFEQSGLDQGIAPVEPDEPSSDAAPADPGDDEVGVESELFRAAPDLVSDGPEAGSSDPVAEDAGGLHDEEPEPRIVLEPAPKLEIYDPAPGAPDRTPLQETLFAEDAPDPELLDRAAKIVLTARRPMPSLLQRRLDLSFAEARQTLAQLEQLGVVRAPAGKGAWTPLIDVAEWEERRA